MKLKERKKRRKRKEQKRRRKNLIRRGKCSYCHSRLMQKPRHITFSKGKPKKQRGGRKKIVNKITADNKERKSKPPYKLLSKTDKLFIEESSSSTGAWIANPADKKFIYSEGYKNAALSMIQKCKESGFWNNILVYPLIFQFRHYLELRLKELIVASRQLVNPDLKLIKNHNIMSLWNQFKKQLLDIEPESTDKEELKNIERLLIEYHQIDPNSESFRYPTDKKDNPTLDLKTIDLENFANVMEKIMDFFDSKLEMFLVYIDWTNDMLNDAYSGYR
ncbi:MAG: hypothetical protein FK732_07030 [Asgard group archaeon]|nr:hypothetical protein [Asgard group archaeon]